jgi:hypothetical protein
MSIPDPESGLDFLPIPDPVSRGQKGTGSRIPDPDQQRWVRANVFRFHPLQWCAHGGEGVGRTVTITLLTREEGFGDSSLVCT